MPTTNADDLLFPSENKREEVLPSTSSFPLVKTSDDASWTLLVVDDEEILHSLTRMVFKDFRFQQQSMTILSAYSGQQARQLIQEYPNIQVILLDVIMETDDAGLAFVEYVRNELKNRFVRIILRTGQAGSFPEQQVMLNYDINDYREKSDLTAPKLITTVTAALRGYQDLKSIEQLVTSNDHLEQRVRERTRSLQSTSEQLQKEIEERLEAETELRQTQERLLAIINNSTTLISLKNAAGRYLLLNAQFCKILNKDIEDIYNKTDEDIFPSSLAHIIQDHDQQVLQAGTSMQFEEKIPHEESEHHYISIRFPLFNAQGKAYRVCSICTDITERRCNEENMRKLASAVEQTADMVMICTYDGIIEYVNPSFEHISGYHKEHILGQKPSILKSDKQGDAFYSSLWSTILRGDIFNEIFINKKCNGELYYEEKTITPLKDSQNNITHFVSTGKDVTERIRKEEHIHFLAHHDPLTQLPNRTLLQNHLKQMLARMRYENSALSILFLDLDRFKIINDSLGHDMGDELLKQIAQRLLTCISEEDLVARLGGDEFAIVLNHLNNKEKITSIAQNILTQLAQPFYCQRHELFVGTSIGISRFPDDGEDTFGLLKKADVAMYRAKSMGGNTCRFYSKEDDERALERFQLENDLRQALKHEEFILYYQPQMDLHTGDLTGLEALIRWQHPQLGLLSPNHFISLLEETGMIIDVGEWVLKTVCHQIHHWQQRHLSVPRIAVNLSTRQFQHQALLEFIAQTLQETGLDGNHLELEVTESVLIGDIDYASDKLQALHKMGIKLAIDDFGTGYSSMRYLRRLPFDTLKIDREFIKDIPDNPDDKAITSAIIHLAHDLDLNVIAEGVENLEQLRFLQQHQCDKIQGFLYSKPLTIVDVQYFMNKDASHVTQPE